MHVRKRGISRGLSVGAALLGLFVVGGLGPGDAASAEPGDATAAAIEQTIERIRATDFVQIEPGIVEVDGVSVRWAVEADGPRAKVVTITAGQPERVVTYRRLN